MKLEQKYDVNQAWTAMLIFFDYLARGSCERLGEFHGVVGWFFARLHIDHEFFLEWEIAFEKERIAQSACSEKVLSQSGVVQLIKEYVSYYQYVLGFNISSLTSMISEFAETSIETESDHVAWKDALVRAMDGETWKLQSFDKIKEFSGDFLIDDFRRIPDKFFEQLLPEFSRFNEETVQRFHNLWSAFSDQHNLEWDELYIGLFKKSCLQQKISSYEFFCTLVAFSAEYSYRYGFDAHEIIRMFYGMQSKPYEYVGNWEVWRRICKKYSSSDF